MRFPEERAQIVHHAKQLKPDGLVVGTSGNLSVRVGDVVLASPSGLDYDDLTPELVCVCDLDGNLLEGPLEPTSEMPLHLSVYHSTPHTAVVHTHARAAAAVSVLVKELPPIHYMTAMFGGIIRVADYATYGTPELAASVGKAMDGRTGCLMANHGTVAAGPSLANAYLLNQHLEWLCDVWLRAATAGAALGVRPAVLDEAEIARVMEKFETYGQAAPPQEGVQ
jgi:L-fuculose-phosphate aldolase